MDNDLISRSEEQYLINSEELFNRVQKLKHYEVRRNLFDEIGIYEVFKCQDVLDAILASDRIDAVPVVRCKDCFYRGRSDCPIFLAPDEGFCHIGSLTGD